ncbi:spindle and kinetochore-associated protein 1 isoform X2 [Tiliqua scincoides]|uniref:spindle and kinetochore-associated protein 1 isoform X2 n=1 Tax=Tiliqua scincoides TaxID=71010 RepID=UPI0034624C7E
MEARAEGASRAPGSEEAGKYYANSSDLNDLYSHINTKISNIKASLQLRKIDREPSLKTVVGKVVHEMFLLNNLLNNLELEFHHQERQQSQLKGFQESIEKDYNEAQHLRENLPIYLPSAVPNSMVSLAVKSEEPCKVSQPERAKKPTKESKQIKEVPFLTSEEFESVPAYMRGRLTYNQVNAVIQEINKAVVSKYKILRQPAKAMSSAVRNLFFRFQEEETKDTKGEFFIVEADIDEFTQLKADKRFHSILTILRHCQRVREIRGSKLVRYAIC